jgi:hypothetical protein
MFQLIRQFSLPLSKSGGLPRLYGMRSGNLAPLCSKENAMEYAILFYETAEADAASSHPEKSAAYWGAWGAYVKAIAESGISKGGQGLQSPGTAKTVRLRGGKRQVQDGPVADAKEQLAGFFIIDVPDLDTALAWAARSPAAVDAAVEVRPVLPPMP